ncbi:Reticulon family protein [Prunus dulcis]|uniref:Reticulon family protein n=1 Tax=Prunus dulcis TaxID=3755 RepID=A0A5H2XTR8_PRUDU|nr:Reticulon family protein [Prunus dulcis]
MDSTAAATPPYHHHSHSEPPSRTKSASRLAQSGQIPHLSLGLITSSPKRTPSPSAHSIRSSDSLPLRELLLLSPSPLRKRSKARLTDRLEMADELVVEAAGPRRRCKSRGAQMGLLGCASPRNTRRSRRRSETEIREDKDSGLVEEIAKPRKRRSKKEKLSLVLSLPSPSASSIDDEYRGSLDRIGQLMNDLIMWRDVARSSLWFGLGSLFFLSSCFAKGINFSIFSAISQLGLLFLGASFVSNSISQRNGVEKKLDFMLKESDILGVAKMILPATNLAISKTRALFSGEPSMTLKLHSFFWERSMGILSHFGGSVCLLHTPKTVLMLLHPNEPKSMGSLLTQKDCSSISSHSFLESVFCENRIFTAFLSLVILRYCRQHMVQPLENGEAEVEQEQQQALAVAVAEPEAEGKQEQEQALVVAEVASKQ